VKHTPRLLPQWELTYSHEGQGPLHFTTCAETAAGALAELWKRHPDAALLGAVQPAPLEVAADAQSEKLIDPMREAPQPVGASAPVVRKARLTRRKPLAT
jgi:hypothetical protein